MDKEERKQCKAGHEVCSMSLVSLCIVKKFLKYYESDHFSFLWYFLFTRILYLYLEGCLLLEFEFIFEKGIGECHGSF